MIQDMEPFSFEKTQAIRAIALEAVTLVKDGMIVGLGTGRSASIFIEELVKRVKNENLTISCVTTSLQSKALIQGKIPLIDEALQPLIDLTFDGADRADPKTFYLIKGGGGALLREKLVANRSKENIMLIDESKLTSPLQDFPIPIEIVEFGYKSTIERICSLGYQGQLRTDFLTNKIIRSDNGNYIFDITLTGPLENPLGMHQQLKQTLGVIETGLFLDTATKIYVGKFDGTIKILESHE